jgi:hypothetical protein
MSSLTLKVTIAVAVAGIGLTACSSSSKGAGTAAAPPSSAARSGSGGGRNAGGGTPPGVFGVVADLSAGSMDVQNQQSGQTTVTYTPSTAFTRTQSASPSSITVGSCITAVEASSGSGGGAPASGPVTVTAESVTVSQPENGSCTGGFGGPNGTGAPSGQPSRSGRPTPTGTNPPGGGGFGRRVSGSVTAVSGSTVSVKATRGGTTVTDTVTLTGSTTVTQTVAADATALKVGECVSAFGPANDTGAVAATRIAISEPGPNGCTTGFGRPNRSGTPSATATTR